jgi:HTH-type transcriptional regulator, glycine betaine synthesis regulator
MENDGKTLNDAKAAMIRCWGEMAPYWGISRTMAEVHALLFVCSRELCTDEIMQELSISRGNASMTLRSLLDWGLVRRVHQKGDRKDYYICDASVWEIFESIARQRSKREVEPVLSTIAKSRDLAAHAEGCSQDPLAAQEARQCRVRLEEMLDFLQVLGQLFESLLKAGPTALRELAMLMARPADGR